MSTSAIGACLCGNYSYEFDREAVLSGHHCHCTDCRTMTGCGKATFVMVPKALVQTKGELKFYTVTGSDGAHVTRGFCPDCGSGILSYLEEMKDVFFIKTGPLVDSSWVTIDSSFWSCSAQPWSPVSQEVPAFEKNPPTV